MTLLQREGERERTRVEFALQAGRLRGSRENGRERMLVCSTDTGECKGEGAAVIGKGVSFTAVSFVLISARGLSTTIYCLSGSPNVFACMRKAGQLCRK